MPNWFYIDAFGQQQGPVSNSQLKALAAQGIIEPDTLLETDTGKKGKASQVKGLFPASPVPVSVPVTEAAPHPPLFSDAEIAAIQAKRTSQSQHQRPQPRERIGSKVRDWMDGLGKYFSAFSGALVVLAIVLFFVLTTASLEGRWVQDHDNDAPKSIEFFKDGTGTWDGLPITWKKESRKRGRRSYDYYLHFQFHDRRIGGGTVEYSIAFSTLTIMFADGNVKYKKQKGNAAVVNVEAVKEQHEQYQREAKQRVERTQQEAEQRMQESQQRQEQMRQEAEQWRQESRQREEQVQRESEQRHERMRQEVQQRQEQMRQEAEQWQKEAEQRQNRMEQQRRELQQRMQQRN